MGYLRVWGLSAMGEMARDCLGLFSPHGFLLPTNLVRASLHVVLYSKKTKQEAVRILPAAAQNWHSVTSAAIYWSKQGPRQPRFKMGEINCPLMEGATGDNRDLGTIDGYLCTLFLFSASLSFSLTSVSWGCLLGKLLNTQILVSGS